MRTARAIRASGLALLVALSTVPARGAALLDLNLKTDGSADPPGDRIVLSIGFQRGEGPVTLEVRAFLVREGHQDPVPVEGKAGVHRDPSGLFVLTEEIRRPDEGQLVDVALVVPYQDLEIPPGQHRLGYEVRGVRAGSVQFVAATPAVAVTIREQPRTSMVLREPSPRSVPRRVQVRAMVRKEGRTVEEETVEIDQQAATSPESSRRVEVNIPGGFVRPTAQRGMVSAAAPPKIASSAVASERDRVVHFATNRNVAADRGTPGERFGNDLGKEVTTGTCRVTIPLSSFHTPGNLERPGTLNFWNAHDRDRFFLIEATNVLALPAFLGSLRIQGKPGDVLVFVHGYNTKFDDMVLRAAQLAHDTGFLGRTVVFSWPSAGNIALYGRDETMAGSSGSALADLLRALFHDRRAAAGTAPSKIHLVAHSMGNRVLLDALNRIAKDPGVGKPFGDIVLAAPDVDVVDFCEQSLVLNDLCDTVTLYSCAKDRALNASRTVHSARRLGEQCFFAKGLDLQNVDADNTDTSFLGHGYIVSGEKVLKDLQLLMMLNLRAEQRPTLIGAETARGSRFWLFR